MPTVAPPRPRDARSPLVRALVRNFVIYNPLFILSAMLVLAGAWLLNPPDPDGARRLSLIVPLFLVIQLYEVALVGAAWTFARRRGLERDARNLALVLAPFLLDITLTNAGLTTRVFRAFESDVPAFLAAAAIVLAAAAKLVLACRLAGRRPGPLALVTLLAGPLHVTLYPLLGWRLVLEGANAASVTFLGALSLAGLVLLAGKVAARGGEDGKTVAAASPLLLGVAALHTASTAWSHTGDVLLALAPALIALGPVLPSLAWPSRRDETTPLVLPLLGLAACLASEGHPFGLTPWSLGLTGVAAVHAVMLRRTGSTRFLASLVVAVDLVALGETPVASFAGLGRSPFELAALGALFVRGLARGESGRALAAPLLLAAIVTARLRLVAGLDALLPAFDVLGLGLLAYTHRVHGTAPAGARQRLVGSLFLWAPAATAWTFMAETAPAAPFFAGGAIVALLGLALLTLVIY
jgi:hypothetical protein